MEKGINKLISLITKLTGQERDSSRKILVFLSAILIILSWIIIFNTAFVYEEEGNNKILVPAEII